MKKAVRIFLVAVDIDPIPGGMDESRIDEDITSILTRSINHYNPRVSPQTTIVRDSDFMDDVTVVFEESVFAEFQYSAENSR